MRGGEKGRVRAPAVNKGDFVLVFIIDSRRKSEIGGKLLTNLRYLELNSYLDDDVP